MPSPWPRAVLFDFDGVIVNSEPIHCRAFQEVLAREGIRLSDDEYYAELIGFDDKGAFRHILGLHNREVTSDEFARLLKTKADTVRDLIARKQFGPLPGVDRFVRGLVKHYPLGICSGALRHEIELMLDGVGLRDCFRVIVAAEDVTIGKPDPMGYLLTAKLLSEKIAARPSIVPEDCLVVEDAPTVARSVKQVGFKVLAVATSYPLNELSVADWAVPSLDPEVVRARIPELKVD